MNYISFHEAFRDRTLIPVNDILKRFPDFDTHRLAEWQEKGYLQKIINRFYAWTNASKTEEQLFFTANRIYPSSYISLKSALSWYNFIPEGVFQYFSVSTRKTKSFETPLGHFHYKHLRAPLFFGYRPVEQPQGGFLIAEPEKALLDTFYLYPYLKDETDMEGLRFDYDEIARRCSLEKLQRYTELFDNRRVAGLSTILAKKISL